MLRLPSQHASSLRMTLSRLALLLALGGVAGQAEAEPALDVIDSAQWTFNKDCVAHGDTLVAVLSYGAQLWDVADPGAPQLIGDYYSAARKAIKIDWLENLLALSTQDGWVQVVDITDPTAPVAASLNNGFGVTPAPLLQRRGGDRLLFAAGSVGLRCLDLADPASPVLRDALSLTGAPRALAAKGDTLFVLADGYGLHAVDSGNPDALVAMDSDSITAAQLLDLDVDGPRLAVAARADGIALFDVGDASNPVLVNQFLVDLGGGALRVKGVRVVGTLLFAAVDSEGFMIYDISNLASPQLLGIAPGTWYNVEELAVDGDRVYLNYWDGATAGAQIFDVSDTAAPVHLGATPAFDYCRNVEVVGDRIYTATGHQGVFLHELVGDELVQRGQFDVLNTWALQADGDRVYVASAGEGFSIGDWSDPDAPVELGALSLGGVCRDVRVSGDLAVVAVFEHGPAFVDISNPANPTLIHQVEMGLFTVALDLRGTLLASADRTGGVNLWDIADPSAPVLLGNYDAGSNAVSVAFRPGRDELAVAAGQVRILDISDPTLPVQTSGFSAASTWLEFGPDGALYVSRNGAGVSVFDALGGGATPVQLASYDTADNAYAVATGPGLAAVADYSGLIVFRTGVSTGATEPPLPARFDLAAMPNPFNPRTDLAFSLPQAGQVRIDVYDVSGRRLIRLADGGFSAGDHRLPWDGRDECDRPQPSGVYFARMEVNGATGPGLGTAKLILIR